MGNSEFSDENLGLFDEDDWKFLDVPETSKNYQYFYDVRDSEYTDEHENSKRNTLIQVAVIVFGGIILIYAIVSFYSSVFLRGASTNADVVNATSEVEETRLVYVDGNQVDNEGWVGISEVFNGYFSATASEMSYTYLDNLCVGGSNLSSTENSYRTSAKASYDTKDCYARALREFSRYITLERVNEIVEKDGIYYCYVQLSIPDSDALYDYYMGYKYEMTKFFGTNLLDYINVTKYMLSITGNNNLPVESKEYLFKVSIIDGEYKIIDDSQVTSISTEAYNSSIYIITSILGGSLVSTQYEEY